MTDTYKKRKAAEGSFEEPQPDGTVDAADRAQVAREYVPTLFAASSSLGYGVNFFGDEDCFTFKRK